MNLKKSFLIKSTNKFLFLFLIISTIVFASIDNKAISKNNKTSFKSTPNSHVTLDFSQVNAESWDSLGDPDNMIGNCLDGDSITGIEWSDLTFETIGNSLLSEIEFVIYDSSLNNYVNFNPASGVNQSGTGVYSSGSILDFTDEGMQDLNSLADGHFLIGFNEILDSTVDAIDAKITSGTIDLWGTNLIESEGCPFIRYPLTTGQADFDVVSLRNKSQVIVTLNDGDILTLNRTELDNTSASQYTWTGLVDGYPDSTVIISIVDGVGSGVIDTVERYWKIEPFTVLTTNVSEIDLNSILEGNDQEQLNSLIFKNGFEQVTQQKSLNMTNMSCGDEPSKVDVMFVYSSEANSNNDIQTKFKNAIKIANKNFRDSEIIVNGSYLKLNLVHTHQISSEQITTSSILETRDDLKINGDKILDEVHTLRDQYNADIVILVDPFTEDTSNLGGVAADASSVPDPTLAFIVMRSEGLEEVFTHEVGHLFGAWHNLFTLIDQFGEEGLSLAEGLAEYNNPIENRNFGYTFYSDNFFGRTQGYYTTMAYRDECKNKRQTSSGLTYNWPVICNKGLNRFSSFNQTYGEDNLPLGDSNTNNVNQLIAAAPIVACHRDSNPTGETQLTVTIEQASNQIDPTPTNNISFIVTFSQNIDISTFDIDDFLIIPSGEVSFITNLSDPETTSFSILVNEVIDGDTISVFLPEGRVEDLTNNGNLASTSLDNQVTYDTGIDELGYEVLNVNLDPQASYIGTSLSDSYLTYTENFEYILIDTINENNKHILHRVNTASGETYTIPNLEMSGTYGYRLIGITNDLETITYKKVNGPSFGHKYYQYYDSVGIEQMISLGPNGEVPDKQSYDGSIDLTGNHFTVMSFADNWFGNQQFGHIYYRNITNDTTIQVDKDYNGFESNSTPDESKFIGGRYIVYNSSASDLVANDINNTIDVFLYDITNQSTIRVSKDQFNNELINRTKFIQYTSNNKIIFGEADGAGNLGGLIYVYDILTDTVSKFSNLRFDNVLGVSKDGNRVLFWTNDDDINWRVYDNTLNRTIIVYTDHSTNNTLKTHPKLNNAGNKIIYFKVGKAVIQTIHNSDFY